MIILKIKQNIQFETRIIKKYNIHMPKNSGILFKWFLILCVIQGITLYAFFGFIFLPAQKSIFENILIERLKTKTNFYFPLVKKALESKNDILMMNSLEEITKDSEFIYARLLDNNGKLLAHNKIQEWGRTLDDTLSKQIIASNEPTFIKTLVGYDYSIPIILSTTKIASFSVGISKAKTDAVYNSVKNKSFKLALAIFAVTIFIYLLVFRFIVILPVKNLQNRIESVILGQLNEKLDLKRNDEIGRLASTIDKLIEKLTK